MHLFFRLAQFFPNAVEFGLSSSNQLRFALVQYSSAVVLKPDVPLVDKLTVKFNLSHYFFFLQKFCNYFTLRCLLVNVLGRHQSVNFEFGGQEGILTIPAGTRAYTSLAAAGEESQEYLSIWLPTAIR